MARGFLSEGAWREKAEGGRPTVELRVHHHEAHDTVAALLVSNEMTTPRRVWLPKSMVTVSDTAPAPSDLCTITLAEWMATKKGLL